VDDVVYGCSKQAGEDKSNVARMASCWRLAERSAGTTVNRFADQAMDAVATGRASD